MISIWLMAAGLCFVVCACMRTKFIFDDFNPTIFYTTGLVLIGLGLLFGGFGPIVETMPEDTICGIRGDGAVLLQNDSYVDIPDNLKNEFQNTSLMEFIWKLEGVGVSTYAELCEYDSENR